MTRLCVNCEVLFVPRRVTEKYCALCRENRVPQRDAQRRYQLKLSKDVNREQHQTT